MCGSADNASFGVGANTIDGTLAVSCRVSPSGCCISFWEVVDSMSGCVSMVAVVLSTGCSAGFEGDEGFGDGG